MKLGTCLKYRMRILKNASWSKHQERSEFKYGQSGCYESGWYESGWYESGGYELPVHMKAGIKTRVFFRI